MTRDLVLSFQLSLHNSLDSQDDFRLGCRNVSQCHQQYSPSQDYTHPDDHGQSSYDMTSGLEPFTKSFGLRALTSAPTVPDWITRTISLVPRRSLLTHSIFARIHNATQNIGLIN